MRALLKSAGRHCLYGPLSTAALRQWQSRGCRILAYHRFDVENARARLEEQCAHLRRYYRPVSLDAVVRSLRDGEPLPRRALAITVDDGYRDFYTDAYPVFRKFGLPITVFLVSGFLDGNCWLWWDTLSYAFLRTALPVAVLPMPHGASRQVELGGPARRQQLATDVSVAATRLPDAQRKALIERICQALRVSPPELPPDACGPLRWDEVRRMAGDGIQFGSHTARHPILGALSDEGQRGEEIGGSKKRIEQELDRPVDHFCFPNGGAGDFGERDLLLIKEAGYQSASTTYTGLNFRSADPYLLRRISVAPEMSLDWYRSKVAGILRLRFLYRQAPSPSIH